MSKVIALELDGEGGTILINATSIKLMKINGRYVEIEFKSDGTVRKYLLKKPVTEAQMEWWCNA